MNYFPYITKAENPHPLRLLSFPLQYTAATIVLTVVATIAGAMIPAGFTLPYWLLYAIILTGISCREEIFKIKNVHISLLAVRPLFFFATAASPTVALSLPHAILSAVFPPFAL